MDTMKNGVRISPLPLGFDGYVGLTNQFYISAGVLSGPHYPNGKPAFMQSWAYSRKLHITGGRVGLIVNFALGVTGGLFVNRSIAHYGTYVLEMPENPDEAYYIWAELNTDGATMSFGFSTKKKLTYSRFEPENPVTGDYWFDIPNNMLKYRKSREVEGPSGEIEIEHYWEEVKRVILGWIAQGTDGYIYSMTSFPLHYWFSKEYPEYVKYDGVSFQTDGSFIAENYEAWKDNVDICTNAANSSVARDTIYYEAKLWSDPIGKSNEMLTGKMLVGWTEQDLDVGLDAINYTGMDHITDVEEVMEKLSISPTATDRLLENQIAMDCIASKKIPMQELAKSSIAIPKVVNNNYMINAISESSVAVVEILNSNFARESFTTANEYSRAYLFSPIFSQQIFGGSYNEFRDSLFEEIEIQTYSSYPQFEYREDCLYIYSRNSTSYSCEGRFVTEPVDITDFNRLKIEWQNTGSDTGSNRSRFGLCLDKDDDFTHILEISADFIKKVDEIDVSDISGQFCIAANAFANAYSETRYSRLYIYRIWLEK